MNTSIVDYLKGLGQDSSYAARAALAEKHGITNYTGSYDQNVDLLTALQGASPARPAQAPQPGASTPAPDPNATAARDAGAGGLSLDDFGKIFGPSSEDQKKTQDDLAKSFGYSDYNDFVTKTFAKPEKSTTDLYNEAYSAAGLTDLLDKITQKKNALNVATGNINENPWLDEASRIGRTGRLQDLAGVDIKNLEDEYQLKLDKVHDLVTRNAPDIQNNQTLAGARLAFLQKAAEDAATEAARTRAKTYLSDYISGSQSAKKPDTVTVGNTLYTWNPKTGNFEAAITGPTSTTSGAKATTEAAQTAVTELLKSKGADGYVDPVRYQELRDDWGVYFNVADFDARFASRLNPTDRARLGVGKATGVDAVADDRSL